VGVMTTPLSTAKNASGAQKSNNNQKAHSFISTVLGEELLDYANE